MTPEPNCPKCGHPASDVSHDIAQQGDDCCTLIRLDIYRHALTEMQEELLKSVESERLALRNNEGLRAQLAEAQADSARQCEFLQRWIASFVAGIKAMGLTKIDASVEAAALINDTNAVLASRQPDPAPTGESNG
jgi:hypothetical protein